MPDQPTDTNRNAIKVALGAALGSALGIITAVRTLSAGQRAAADGLTPQPPSPLGKGEPEGDGPSGGPRYSRRVPPPQWGVGQGVGSSPAHPDWEPLPAAHLPRPTYWPVVLALGIIFLAWGIVTTIAITAVGLLLLALGLGGWIGALRNGHQ